jgi:predicted transcriptional regulator of viral defense system
MNHLGKSYYVSTLSAAALHGASHQKQQVFTFVSDRVLHPKEKSGVLLKPLLKKRIPHKYVGRKNVNSGAINVSDPILTAIDLVLYPLHAGGFGNIATVLSELTESMEMDTLEGDFFDFAPASAVQRLGYLIDAVLGEGRIADSLLAKARDASVKFRKTPLAMHLGVNEAADHYDAKWKIIANENVEVDI